MREPLRNDTDRGGSDRDDDDVAVVDQSTNHIGADDDYQADSHRTRRLEGDGQGMMDTGVSVQGASLLLSHEAERLSQPHPVRA